MLYKRAYHKRNLNSIHCNDKLHLREDEICFLMRIQTINIWNKMRESNNFSKRLDTKISIISKTLHSHRIRS